MKQMISAVLLLVLLLAVTACGTAGQSATVVEPPTEEISGSQNAVPSEEVSDEQSVSGEAESAGQQVEQPEASNIVAPDPLQIWMGSHYESAYAEDSTLLCSAAWNDLLLGEDYATKFPALDDALRRMAAENDSTHRQFLEEMLPLATEAAAENSDFFFGYTGNSEYTLQRADSQIVSIRADEDEYTGGVHPNYWVNGINLNPTTGLPVALNEVLTETVSLPDILTEKIRAKYTFDTFDDLPSLLAAYEAENYTWTIDYQGITFYFSPYEIAPYAAGLLTATIWFEERPELFAEDYLAAPENGWVKVLPIFTDVEVDLEKEIEVQQTLCLSVVENENMTLDLYLTRNGQQQLLEDCYGYVMKPMLVCTGAEGQERYFLYIEATADNDYSNLYLYDLNGDSVAFLGEVPNVGSTWTRTEDREGMIMWCEEIIGSPTFAMESTLQILGTWKGSKPYAVDPETGTVQAQAEHYTISNEAEPITSVVDIEVTILPQMEKEILSAGTVFQILRTDGEHYADLKLDDGRECRIQVTRDGYVSLINGIPEWECFWDLPYAG